MEILTGTPVSSTPTAPPKAPKKAKTPKKAAVVVTLPAPEPKVIEAQPEPQEAPAVNPEPETVAQTGCAKCGAQDAQVAEVDSYCLCDGCQAALHASRFEPFYQRYVDLQTEAQTAQAAGQGITKPADEKPYIPKACLTEASDGSWVVDVQGQLDYAIAGRKSIIEKYLVAKK